MRPVAWCMYTYPPSLPCCHHPAPLRTHPAKISKWLTFFFLGQPCLKIIVLKLTKPPGCPLLSPWMLSYWIVSDNPFKWSHCGYLFSACVRLSWEHVPLRVSFLKLCISPLRSVNFASLFCFAFRVCPVLTHFILRPGIFTILLEEQSCLFGQPSPSDGSCGHSATSRQLQFSNRVKYSDI